MTYNVISEPWICAKKNNGQIEYVSLYNLLKNADAYSSLGYARPQEEFSVFMFIEMFVMDAYVSMTNIADKDDEEEMDDEDYVKYKWRDIANGIDMNVIDSYVEFCESEGLSWDVLDNEKPFMQLRNIEELKPESLGWMDWSIPKGKNVLYLSMNNEYVKTIPEAIVSLLTASRYAFPMGSGYKNNINGSNKLYVRLHGNTILEMIYRNLLTQDRKGCDVNKGYGIPFYRKIEQIIENDTVVESEMGWLAGLVFPRLVYRFYVNENGLVSGVYYKKGYLVENNDGQIAWLDPYMILKMDKDNNCFALSSAKKLDTVCYNINYVSDVITVNNLPVYNVFTKMKDRAFDSKNVEIDVFCACSSNSKWLSDEKETQCIPRDVLMANEGTKLKVFVKNMSESISNMVVTKLMKAYLTSAVADISHKSVSHVTGNSQRKSRTEEGTSCYIDWFNGFHTLCKQAFQLELLQHYTDVDTYYDDRYDLTDAGKEYMQSWREIIANNGIKICDEMLCRYGVSQISEMVKRKQAERIFKGKLKEYIEGSLTKVA